MQLHWDLIKNSTDLLNLIKNLKQETLIAFDTEFVREKTFKPQLALIQIATAKEAWLIDALAFTPKEMQPLLEILTDKNILKVLHSSYGDQECLFFSFGITATPTLDTYEAGALLGYGESISLRDLLRHQLGVSIEKHLSRTDWLRRPVSEEMKQYAMSDVQYMVEVGKKILRELEKRERKEWALELSADYEDPKLYQVNPEETAYRLAKSGRISPRGFHILKDLIQWRDRRALEINIPRKRVAQDDALISIANAAPKNLEALEKFRGLNPGEVRKHGKEILKILHPPKDAGEKNLPPRLEFRKPNPTQARIIDFLGTYLKVLCQKFQVASRLILTVPDLQKIVVDNLQDPEQWVQAKICTRRACDLVGKDLREVLQGKRALAIRNEKLEELKMEGFSP